MSKQQKKVRSQWEVFKLKAVYKITCNRCGYEWTGKKGSKHLFEMITREGIHYRLCSDCICDIGRAKTQEEKDAIIDAGKIQASVPEED